MRFILKVTVEEDKLRSTVEEKASLVVIVIVEVEINVQLSEIYF